jgi:hypothetical protein
MKVFCITFNSNTIARQVVLNYLDTLPSVLNWYAVFPGTVYIVSRADIYTLQEKLRIGFLVHDFIISEISGTTTGGYSNKEVWNFINSPKSSGRWE